MAFSENLDQLPHLSVLLPCIAITVLFAKYTMQLLSPTARRLRSLPVVQEKDDIKLRQSLQKAFDQYSKHGQFYKLNESSHEVVIIPPKFMAELKALPETKVSFSEELFERFDGELTGVGRFQPDFIKTITGALTKRIPQIMPELAEELDYAFQGLTGDSQKPVPITMLPAAQRIISVLSSRVFVGEPLCHDEDWVHSMIVHTVKAFSAAQRIWGYPLWLRPYIAPYFQEFKDMHANKMNVERMLAPLIAERQKATLSEESGDEFDDILTALIKNAPPSKKGDISYHARNQCMMSVAGIHTTAQMLTFAIYNLAAYPEYVQDLREELHMVLRPHDTEPNTLTVSKALLAKLMKLDSFMKETQRKSPLGLIGMNRKVTDIAGCTLSNGLHLPYGTFTASNTHHIVNDPSIYPEPEKFDGFRFSKLFEEGRANATKYQFTTVNPEFATFGQGTHSCPGRFFAGAEIKLALIYVLLHYDVSFEEGQTRPAEFTNGVLQGPNPSTKVVFTPRSDAWNLVGDDDHGLTR